VDKFSFACFVLLLTTGMLSASCGHAATTTIPVSDDTYAANYEPDKNFGASDLLLALTPNADVRYEVFLKFTIPDIPVAHATLRLYALQSSGTCQISRLPDSADDWNETSLTWGNRPTSGDQLGSLAATAPGAVTFDITTAVQAEKNGNHLLSLRLSTPLSGGGNLYCAKQVGVEYAPCITIE
jgi:hypothetical protein